MGSSFAAIEAVARDEGYVIVDVEPGYDLFLARADRWGARPGVLTGAELERRAYRPFNLPADRGTAWGARKVGAYLDAPALLRSGGLYAAARAPVAEHFARMRREGRPCFENGARRDLKGPSCTRAQKGVSGAMKQNWLATFSSQGDAKPHTPPCAASDAVGAASNAPACVPQVSKKMCGGRQRPSPACANAIT